MCLSFGSLSLQLVVRLRIRVESSNIASLVCLFVCLWACAYVCLCTCVCMSVCVPCTAVCLQHVDVSSPLLLPCESEGGSRRALDFKSSVEEDLCSVSSVMSNDSEDIDALVAEMGGEDVASPSSDEEDDFKKEVGLLAYEHVHICIHALLCGFVCSWQDETVSHPPLMLSFLVSSLF